MAANVRSHCQRMRAPVKRCPTPARTRRRALMGQRTRAGIEQRLTDRVRSLTSVTMTGSCSRSSRLTRQMLPAETHASPPLPTMTCSSVSSMNRLPAARAVTGWAIFDTLANGLTGVLEVELFHRRRRELMRAMAARAGKNFRIDNVSIAMVVRYIGFRLGYTRKHYPGPLRTC
jgi:hypothetical protein